MKKLAVTVAVLASFACMPFVQAASTGVGGGTVRFFGKVTDASCDISVNGQGSDADVYLSPVSKTEVNTNPALSYLKPQSFNIAVTNCEPAKKSDDNKDVSTIGILWTGGNLMKGATKDTLGYLANDDVTGAQNIQLVLSTSESLPNNKIVPGDSLQPRSKGDQIVGGMRFNYFVGYSTATPELVTSGLVSSYATYEVTYE